MVVRIFSVYKGSLPCLHFSLHLGPIMNSTPSSERRQEKGNNQKAIFGAVTAHWQMQFSVSWSQSGAAVTQKVLLEASVACVLQTSLKSLLPGKYLSETHSEVMLLKGHRVS